MQNSDVSEERKSQPIYSDLETSSGLNPSIQQKYAGDDVVDLVSVAMHWIKNASEKNTQVLAETMHIYHGIGRGSEHAFLWYSEAAWDPFFEAIDFDWAIIKQLSHSACYSSATETDTAYARTFPSGFSFCLAAFGMRPQRRQQRTLYSLILIPY
jgi:hypothetical protein